MEIQRLLSQTPEKLQEYCESLSDEEKQNLYKQAVDAARGKSLRELKQLRKLATAIEKVTDAKLLEYDDNPFHREAVLSFFYKISRHLRLVVQPLADSEELNELDTLLPRVYEKLKPRFTSRMRSNVEKELKFNSFLRDNIETFRFVEETRHSSIVERKKATIELIRLFLRQPELDLEGDMFLLGLISYHIGVFSEDLKYKIEALVNSLRKGLKRLEELENDVEGYREFESRLVDKLVDRKNKVTEQLSRLAINYTLLEEPKQMTATSPSKHTFSTLTTTVH